ncbi:MAG: hypothetical protein NTV09_13215, partial [Bacteroidetes bacterium]|nr:hypothetical protein [Bacteroidota bacterium]
HPRINEAQLREVFPDSLVSRYGVFANLKSAKEKSKTSGKKRYFVNDSQVFELGGEDGKKYAVTNQITSAIMVKFMEHIIAKGLWEN